MLTDEYVELAVVLGYSITMYAALDSRVDRILITPLGEPLATEDQQSLEHAGWCIHQLPSIPPPQNVTMNTVKHARFLTCFSKLHAFNMTQYEEVVLLDADTLVCGGIMDLFTVHARRMRETAVHLGWVHHFMEDAGEFNFNVGVMLIRPCMKLANELHSIMLSTTLQFKFAEQGFLNDFFNVSNTNGHVEYAVLPHRFNLMASMTTLDPELFHKIKPNARIFHYVWLKPTAYFFLPRCHYMGTIFFCEKWTSIRRIAYDTSAKLALRADG